MSGIPITASNIRLRKNFGRMVGAVSVPNLIELQKRSYEEFLQKDVDPDRRKKQGLQVVFHSVFPIVDYKGLVRMEFIKYTLQHPNYDIEECRQRKMSYAAPLKILLRLVVFDIQKETEKKEKDKKGEDKKATEKDAEKKVEEKEAVKEKKVIKDVKEQEVFLGEIPLMTESGSFIINGTERVIVSQLHRSHGCIF